MASPKPPDADLRVCDMKLLETGNFADAEIVCGDKTFKIHKSVVCTRSVWFEKALTGGFEASNTARRQPSHPKKTPGLIIWMVDQEATTGKVNIKEQNPEAIKVILKYIYGGAAAVNMAEETTKRPVIRFCVDLYRAAAFFLLTPMLPIVQRRLGDYCDEKLRRMCTRGNTELDEIGHTALPWIWDLADGINEAYKWNTEPMKKTLMEFVWVGRRRLLGTGRMGIQADLDNSPAFIEDMLRNCAMFPWQEDSDWAPRISSTADLAVGSHRRCARCNKELAKWSVDNSDADGQVWDPFTVSGDNMILRKWCKDCGAMDMAPWREIRT